MVRGQMKIQQMAFVLIAATLFFSLAGIFILSVKMSGLRGLSEELEARNAQMLVTKLANSPEFACGDVFGGGGINCVDADKIMALKSSVSKYRTFWGIENIEIRIIYPESAEVVCEAENYPNCNAIRVLSDNTEGVEVSNFVSLCRKESYEGGGYDKCEIATMMVIYGGNDEE